MFFKLKSKEGLKQKKGPEDPFLIFLLFEVLFLLDF